MAVLKQGASQVPITATSSNRAPMKREYGTAVSYYKFGRCARVKMREADRDLEQRPTTYLTGCSGEYGYSRGRRNSNPKTRISPKSS